MKDVKGNWHTAFLNRRSHQLLMHIGLAHQPLTLTSPYISVKNLVSSNIKEITVYIGIVHRYQETMHNPVNKEYFLLYRYTQNNSALCPSANG